MPEDQVTELLAVDGLSVSFARLFVFNALIGTGGRRGSSGTSEKPATFGVI